MPRPDVTILGHKVDVVDSFVYLGSLVDASGGNDSDIRRRIEMARTCMKSLHRGIWLSSISLITKLRLYNVYILPVLLYGSDAWSVTEVSRQRLDAFDQWCLRRILCVPYTAYVTNVSVRSQTDLPPVSSLIQQRRHKLFGHIARAAASKDHSRALRASTDRLPVDWCRPRGRPRHFWLRTIDSELKPLNLALREHRIVLPGDASWKRLCSLRVPPDDEMMMKHCITWEVEGIRQRGRPKKTWWDCVKNDMESLGLSQKDAQSRNKWRRKSKGATG